MRAWRWSGWFFIGFWLCTYATYAQPTINPQVAWQHQYQPANRVNYVALAQLTQHRFIAAGYAEVYVSRWVCRAALKPLYIRAQLQQQDVAQPVGALGRLAKVFDWRGVIGQARIHPANLRLLEAPHPFVRLPRT